MFDRRLILPVVFALSVSTTPALADDPARPNIIFILADDLGYGDIGVHGQAEILTPSIDRLAEEGLRFTQAYAANPICAPSRCALMTGRHVGHCSSNRNASVNMPLRVEDPTVAEVLQGAGYTTAMWGKWGLGGELPSDMGGGEINLHSIPLTKGFDHSFAYRDQGVAWFYYAERLWMDGEEYPIPENADEARAIYSHDLFVDDTFAFIEQHAGDPFYLQLSYTIPHARMEVPDLAPYEAEPWPWIEQTFAAMITRLDTDIGDLLLLLDELGIADDTLVIFSSDNGPHECETDGAFHDAEFFGSSGGFRGHKHDLFEGGIRVPFIARWPGVVAAGAVSDEIVAHIDFLPTAADLAGAAAPGAIDGTSLAPLLTGDGEFEPTDYRYWEYNGEVSGNGEPLTRYAIRRGDTKYVQLYDGVELLYDLDADPAETTSIAADHVDVLEEMRQIIEVEDAGVPHPAVPRLVLEGDLDASSDLPADDPDHLTALYLRFEEGSAGEPASDVDDEQGDPSNDGTAVGDPLYTDDVFAPDVPNTGATNLLALALDSASPQYVSVAHHPSLWFSSDSFTVEAWVRLDALATGTTSDDRRWLAVKKAEASDDQTTEFGFLAQAGAAVHANLRYGKQGGFSGRELAVMFANDNYQTEGIWAVVSNLEIQDTDWHYVSVAYDAYAGIVRFVLDGDSEAIVVEDPGRWSDLGPLTIGAHPNLSGVVANGLDGGVDELRISRGFVPEEDLLNTSGSIETAEIPVYTIDFGVVEIGGTPIVRTFEAIHAAEEYAHMLEGEVSAEGVGDPRITVESGPFGPLADGGRSGTITVTLDPHSAGPIEGQTITVLGRARTYGFPAMGSPAQVSIIGEVLAPEDDDDSAADDDTTTPPSPDDDGCGCGTTGSSTRASILFAALLLTLGLKRRRP